MRTGAAARLRCPFCHDALGDRGELVACEACGAPHHAACLREARRCSAFGCGARPGLPSLLDANTPAEIREVFQRRARWYVASRRTRAGQLGVRLGVDDAGAEGEPSAWLATLVALALAALAALVVIVVRA